MVIMTSEDGHHKCDEKCYDAKRIKCTCICGGKNHGKGLRQALKNLQELVDDEIEMQTALKEFVQRPKHGN